MKNSTKNIFSHKNFIISNFDMATKPIYSLMRILHLLSSSSSPPLIFFFVLLFVIAVNKIVVWIREKKREKRGEERPSDWLSDNKNESIIL